MQPTVFYGVSYRAGCMDYILEELILDNTILRVLEHFRLARVDYAKNVAKYTEISRDLVASSIRELESHGLLERYTNTSVKKTDARLKKSAEVHKHHTYYEITRSGIIALNTIGPPEYLLYLTDECLSYLTGNRKANPINEGPAKLIMMGLLNRRMELTTLGKQVLSYLKKK